MNSHNVKITKPRALILGALAVLVLQAGPLAAKTDACALLKAADVAPLLGGTPTNTTTPERMTHLDRKQRQATSCSYSPIRTWYRVASCLWAPARCSGAGRRECER